MLRRILQELFPGPRAAVLHVLARTEAPLTGRTVASLVAPKLSLRAVQVALSSLVEIGVVAAQPAGRSLLYTLQRDHLAAGPILALTRAYDDLKSDVRAMVDAWIEPPTALWIFGSQARGDATVKSDIDVVVIRRTVADQDTEDWDRTIGSLLSFLRTRTGGNADVLELSEVDVERMLSRGDALVDELLRDADTVMGPSPRELFKARQP